MFHCPLSVEDDLFGDHFQVRRLKVLPRSGRSDEEQVRDGAVGRNRRESSCVLRCPCPSRSDAPLHWGLCTTPEGTRPSDLPYGAGETPGVSCRDSRVHVGRPKTREGRGVDRLTHGPTEVWISVHPRHGVNRSLGPH